MLDTSEQVFGDKTRRVGFVTSIQTIPLCHLGSVCALMLVQYCAVPPLVTSVSILAKDRAKAPSSSTDVKRF